MTYKQVDEQLQGRYRMRRKVAKNTYLRRADGTPNTGIALRFHNTDIITWESSGAIILNSGGFHTCTTKKRINEYLPEPYSLFTEKGVWFLTSRPMCMHPKYMFGDHLFKDGITIQGTGRIVNAGKYNPKRDVVTEKRVRAYAKLCVSKLPLPKPGLEDCFVCSIHDDVDKSSDHIDQHIQEGYVIPSLVANALKEAGAGVVYYQYAFGNKPEVLSFMSKTIERFIYRYIMKRKGFHV